ncbi:carbohydrate kinase family protein [Sporosarcina aquimarina]|uniref:Carbohydrate kinase n=1 Tax=Sporosarcina aquimarina TaxID=114975 RepID=A0ABU4FVP6_9BACL|nr:carbohydrate kinase [Sporosarcina aquimarina]MDW0108781.1 carbohydrate kinase [Sporosarcina aquimarina]
MNKHVLVYGDVFVDYIAEDETNSSFHTYLGGATVNVAAGVARLGAPVSFITVTGSDETSEFVRKELQKEGVDLSAAIEIPEKRVNGVFVHLTPEHDRVFADYQNETPDLQVTAADLKEKTFQQTSILHICSGTMFHPTAFHTTKQAVRMAKASGALISFDANIRPLRWESEEICRETTVSFLKEAHLVKLTEEELTFMMNTESLEVGIRKLENFSIPVVMITQGENGTLVLIDGETIRIPTVKTTPVDTTGAGDAFMAGVLCQMYKHGGTLTLDDVSVWKKIIQFGNRMGAICVTKPGALSAMPHAQDLLE